MSPMPDTIHMANLGESWEAGTTYIVFVCVLSSNNSKIVVIIIVNLTRFRMSWVTNIQACLWGLLNRLVELETLYI